MSVSSTWFKFGAATLTLICSFMSLAYAQNLSTGSDDPTDPLINQGPKSEAVGDEAMVSTQTPQVTEAALEVLRQGGNAFDAFITAVLLQQVLEPHMVSHWGVMTGLLYDAETETYRAFDGIGQRPLASRGSGGDPMKVSIGGTVKALGEIWERHGSMPWESYFEPAIRAADEGVLVTSFMYGIIYAAWENPTAMWPGGVRDLIDNEEARKFYRPNGFQVPVGGRWKIPTVATHMRKLAAEGPDYMYTGEWAEQFVEESNQLGGRVSMEDMAEYEVKWRDPLRFTYRDYEIVSEAPPIYGGLIVGYSLNILENFDLRSMGHFSESAEALDVMVRTADRVFSEIDRLKDPENFHTPTALLLSKEYGRMGAVFVRNTTVLPGVDLRPSVGDQAAIPPRGSSLSYDSNHNVIVDAAGNWITSLHSGHGGTPGYFVDGVEANGSTVPGDTMGPGRRLLAPLAATIVVKDGKPWWATTSTGNGGARQHSRIRHGSESGCRGTPLLAALGQRHHRQNRVSDHRRATRRNGLSRVSRRRIGGIRLAYGVVPDRLAR